MNIIRPTLVLNKTTCLQNIELMAEKAKRHKLTFRPHFKTHQSAEIGRWFRDFGTEKITVSSVTMANYFISDGWKDVTIAIPFNILEIPDLNKISNNCTINLVVDSPDSVKAIGNNTKRKLGIYIKISTGYERSGVEYSAIHKIEELLSLIHI